MRGVAYLDANTASGAVWRRRAFLLAMLVTLMFLLPGGGASVLRAGEAARGEAEVVSADRLDRSIAEVLERREFAWRLPRVKAEKDIQPPGFFSRLIKDAGDAVLEWLVALRELIRDFINWIGKWIKLRQPSPGGAKAGTGWMTGVQLLVFVLIVVVASAVVLLLWRAWRVRRGRREVVVAQPVTAAPDLRDENVSAAALPEDDWLKLARELMQQGELRLALRALYLCGLAHLAGRELVSLARFKSNRDYELELRRRARTLPEVQAAFSENVLAFDRVWYGMHEVTPEHLDGFQRNLERIRAC